MIIPTLVMPVIVLKSKNMRINNIEVVIFEIAIDFESKQSYCVYFSTLVDSIQHHTVTRNRVMFKTPVQTNGK